ncbi:MAG: transglutaminase-like domain-containing protein [Candidatus Woesearchaeota archaeon]|nr:transglutaminase-like domain-containing protein [Candidatus Woesearchaeota archaeon]
MKQFSEKITEVISGEIEKIKAIFEWVATNIQYGSKKRKPRVIYRGALQVYQDKEGVCGESATLQVTLERLVGNKAFLVEVGEKHACAAHLKPDNTIILIETTHKNGYNTQYPDFKILSDDYSFTCTGYD